MVFASASVCVCVRITAEQAVLLVCVRLNFCVYIMYVGFEACVFSESMPKGGCGLIKESEWRSVWMCGWGGGGGGGFAWHTK